MAKKVPFTVSQIDPCEDYILFTIQWSNQTSKRTIPVIHDPSPDRREILALQFLGLLFARGWTPEPNSSSLWSNLDEGVRGISFAHAFTQALAASI